MFIRLLFIFLASFVLVSSLEARINEAQQKEQDENLRYNKTIKAFMEEDEKIKQLVYGSYAYIVFPSIGKGGLIFGGAFGNGRAYRRGMWIGDVSLAQYTFGLQVGGQSYSEIIFFASEKSFTSFQKSGLMSGTQTSLIAGTSSASADANIGNGVIVYTSGNGGLMLEATTGAQDFTYTSREHR